MLERRLNRHCQHIQDGNGIQRRVIFAEFTQSFTYLGVDDMDIVVNHLKTAEICGNTAAFLVNEILGQKKHGRCPVNYFIGVSKRLVISGHWPEIFGMGAAASRNDQPQQRT